MNARFKVGVKSKGALEGMCETCRGSNIFLTQSQAVWIPTLDFKECWLRI